MLPDRAPSTATGSDEVNHPPRSDVSAAPAAPGCPSSFAYAAPSARRLMTIVAARAANGRPRIAAYTGQLTSHPMPTMTASVRTNAPAIHQTIFGSSALDCCRTVRS